MRLTIESQSFAPHVWPLIVTMSLGIAGTDDWPGLSVEALIQDTDLALQRGQELGTNSCVLARPTGL